MSNDYNVNELVTIEPPELFQLHSYDVIGYVEYNNICSDIKEKAKQLIIDYYKASDLLYFLSEAFDNKKETPVYKLSAPCTTAKIDANYILGILLNTNIISDVYYSDYSNEFLIKFNYNSVFTIRDLLRIGITELLKIEKRVKIYLGSEIMKDEHKRIIDITYINNKILYVYNIELSPGLNWPQDKLNTEICKLKNNVVNNRLKMDSVSIIETWIVSNHMQKVLYPLRGVISIDELMSTCY